jgi:rhamnogalacturonyl hydrolase YesR
MISFSDSREYISIDNIRQDQLVELFTNLSNTVIQYQKGNGAFSWQITVVGRPDDISVTCMITYSILKGIKLNVLPQLFMSNVNRATYYLLSGTSDDGFVNNCSAEREGFSRYPQRYGWYPWGQGYTLALLSNILITEDVSA